MKFFQNILKSVSLNKFKKISVGHHILVYDPNFDKGLREYYSYILDLFQKVFLALPQGGAPLKIILGIPQYPKNPKEVYQSIDFQVEHVLVKPEGRGAENAPIGKTKIIDSDAFYTVRIQDLERLLSMDMIIDYSRPNLKHIQDSGLYPEYLSKVCVISPTLYPIQSSSILNRQRSKHTITLFRNTEEPRRKQFLDHLKKSNVVSENVNHVFENLNRVYEDTKILINMHQTGEHHTLEELRVLPALRCGIIVVSEDSPLKKYSRISDFIIWGTLEELPERIKDVQDNYESYHQKIFTSHFFRRMERLEKSNFLRLQASLKKLKF